LPTSLGSLYAAVKIEVINVRAECNYDITLYSCVTRTLYLPLIEIICNIIVGESAVSYLFPLLVQKMERIRVNKAGSKGG
jgi:hypothetical protein